MNRRRKTMAISLALILLTPQGAFASGKTSVVIKKAGRATTQIPNTILSGSGVPAKSVGIEGDFYIDIKNANLYGPKLNGIWKVATSLRNPGSKEIIKPTSGVDGAVGAKGATGATGDRGLTGAKGDTGLTGPAGTNGSQGVNGLPGAKGDTGATGATGASGANGIAGSIGLTGPTGPIGANGAAGLTGSSGTTGTPGANGTAGTNGAAGAKGDTGLTGAAGISNAYFVDIQQWTLTTAQNSGTSDSAAFGNLTSGGSYAFEIMLDGTFSPGTASVMTIGMQLIASATPTSFQYRVFATDSTAFINAVGGRHYQFLVMGTIVCGASTTSLTLRAVDQYGATASNMLSFSGKALINKVGAIG